MNPNLFLNTGKCMQLDLGVRLENNQNDSSVITSSVMVTTIRPAIKPKIKQRSRNGCMNCKKLRIKCNEAKPSCEYCVHRRRVCVYPEPVIRSASAKSKNQMLVNEVIKQQGKFQNLGMYCQNRSVVSLNSMTNHLAVDIFELRLLRHFLDFGGEFFSFNKNDEVYHFWHYEVSRLWGGSELMKTALLALSSLKLLHQFELNSITNVYLQDDLSIQVYSDPVMTSGTNIYELTDKYFQSTLKLLQKAMLHSSQHPTVENAGFIIAVNIIIFAFVSVHPISPVSLTSLEDEPTDLKVDLLSISSSFFWAVYSRYPYVMGSAFECLVYPRERLIIMPKMISDSWSLTHFIGYLKHYVELNVEPNNLNKIIYREAIDVFELGCYKALTLGYIMPVFRVVLSMARDAMFIRLAREKDFIALKILFFYSSVCSISGFKLFLRESVWDTYVNDYKSWIERKYHGLDEYDKRLYDLMLSFNRNEYRFQLNMLKHLGDPNFAEMFPNVVLSNELEPPRLGLPDPAK